ncbi:MAG: CRISPR-associated protein Cas4 [Acidobacteriota bacterium]|nr:CRISPR-associated protein Cas4 [Acidobacteriota bacterium]
MNNEKLTRFTGTEVGYYFICKKKLWWFHRGIQMEHEHDESKKKQGRFLTKKLSVVISHNA